MLFLLVNFISFLIPLVSLNSWIILLLLLLLKLLLAFNIILRCGRQLCSCFYYNGQTGFDTFCVQKLHWIACLTLCFFAFLAAPNKVPFFVVSDFSHIFFLLPFSLALSPNWHCIGCWTQVRLHFIQFFFEFFFFLFRNKVSNGLVPSS